MEKVLRKKLEEFVEKNDLIHRGDAIVIGLSGGADSVCLLHLLSELSGDWGLSLRVLHVHHGIRGGEADRDAEFAEKMAAGMGLPFCLVREDVPRLARERGLTVEEAGRAARYERLEEYREKTGADRIAVAHHRNDQAETVLFQLFRGSGPRGLAGIPAKRGFIIRPLLFAGRDEIREYLGSRGIPWLQDSTNGDLSYSRNRIRHDILPRAEEGINRQAARHIAATAEKMAQWCRYIDRAGEKAFEAIVANEGDIWYFSTERFKEEDPVIRAEILRRILERLIPGAKDIGQAHYDQMMALAGAEPGKRVSLPGGVQAEKEYGRMLFYKKKDVRKAASGVSITCRIPSTHIVKEGLRISLEVRRREDLPSKIPQKDYTKWFDYDMIKSSLVVRNPREGDYFVLDSLGNRKRLNRYYIDRKVPRHLRGEQLVLADGSHVLWAVPDRVSEAYKITDYTKMVLVVTMEGEADERRDAGVDR